jgi:hypothetical protein
MRSALPWQAASISNGSSKLAAGREPGKSKGGMAGQRAAALGQRLR